MAMARRRSSGRVPTPTPGPLSASHTTAADRVARPPRSGRRAVPAPGSLSSYPTPTWLVDISGAGEWTRTTDLLITNQLLCQLSYTGESIRYVFPCRATALNRILS
jgi:hypothetical protein